MVEAVRPKVVAGFTLGILEDGARGIQRTRGPAKVRTEQRDEWCGLGEFERPAGPQGADVPSSVGEGVFGPGSESELHPLPSSPL